MNKLIHNCPNCGAALTSDGYCNYCKTKIRYANIIEIEGLNPNPYGCLVPVEILLKFKNENGETLLMPFIGNLDQLSVSYDDDCVYGNATPIFRRSKPNIDISFSGTILDTEVQDGLDNMA